MDSIGVARTPDHGQLWRHVLKLASGAALAQVVVLATAPLLTRYYAPDAFGVSAFFISFVAICGPIGNLNYFQAIMLPRDDAEALRLAELSLGVSLCMSVLVLGAAFVLRGLLGSPFHVPELIPYFWLFPMGIMLRSAFLVLTAWSARHRFYGAQARARVAQTVTERALSLVAGLTGLGSGVTLVFSRLASLILENAMLLSSGLAARSSLRSRAAHTGTSPSEAQRHSLGTVARNYREFPIASWTTLLANGSSQVTALLLPVLFSTEVAGLYALGNRLIQTPFMLLGESIRNVYYKELAERIATGRETRSGFVALRRHLVAAGMFPHSCSSGAPYLPCFLARSGSVRARLPGSSVSTSSSSSSRCRCPVSSMLIVARSTRRSSAHCCS
jgi:O-antigen/teichoic acid export membrane protein